MYDKGKAREYVLSKYPQFKSELKSSISREEQTIARHKRAFRYKEMREQGMTLEAIGKKENLTRERIRQMLKEINAVGKEYNHNFKGERIERVKKICPRCSKSFMSLDSQRKRHCSRDCANLWVVLIGKPVKEWTEADFKKRDKIRNFTPKAIANRKRYYEENIKAKK